MNDEVRDLLNLKKESPQPPNPLGDDSAGPVADFLSFKTMITPKIIAAFFWIGAAYCVWRGIVLINTAYHPRVDRWHQGLVAWGLAWIFLGPLVVRVFCEVCILFFRINATLTEINRKIK